MSRLFWLLFAVLVLLRVPSLAQPAGADQSLYAYAGQRILDGELPYRDAWDQKPPAIHFTYALMWALWPDDRVVAAADLAVAVATALALLGLGRRLGGPGTGEVAALLFLLLGNPALGRLGGVRVRAQSEVFIGLATALGFLLLHRACRGRTGALERGLPDHRFGIAAGALFGLAFLYKYPAGASLPAALAAAAFWMTPAAPGRSTLRRWPALALGVGSGFAGVVAAALALFWAGGALIDLYHATITYNLFYSGETYASRWALLEYLVTFPVRHARIDALWFLGGLGSAVLLAAGAFRLVSRREALAAVDVTAAPLWVAAACVAIAVNGSRGLPQYFVQAYPALALAAALAATIAWRASRPRTRALLAILLVLAVQRISNFDKVADYTAWDLRAWTGSLARDEYLSRFGGRDTGDKYSALAVRELAEHLQAQTPPERTVLVFGFSPGALVQSDRRSASRFFWSRPLIVGFGEGWPGYGIRGLHDELTRTTPSLVVLQKRDWDPDTVDSYTFFMSRPELTTWLDRHYTPAGTLGNFVLFERRDEG